MAVSRCMCGIVVEAADQAALVDAFLAHVHEAHPGLGLTRTQATNYFAAEARLNPPAERVARIDVVDVHPATAERLDDLLGFFDHDGFAGNPGWASCYCTYHHLGGDQAADWPERTWTQNRELLCRRVRARTTTGLLAYADGSVAAWCNASPRSEFPEHAGRDDHPDDVVGSIVCFVVAPPYRRHGLAARLLDAACRSFAERGFVLAEAYPRKETRGDASGYHGPLSMYLGAGFRKVAEHGNVVVVEKAL